MRIAIAPCAALHDYEESLRRCGADVCILNAAADEPAEVVRSFDGLLLAGGGDIDPALYGESPHSTFVVSEPGRDAYEIALVQQAVARQMPLFAICRGIQVLNVALGGTLVQDVATQLEGAVNHSVREPSSAIAHDVWITADTLLATLLRERLEGDTCAVNSRHHQAVKDLGEGLIVTATAPDGVIEAIEAPGQRFCVGVQWHPENFYRTGEFRALFEGFVTAADTRG